jgi:hypothetical protein
MPVWFVVVRVFRHCCSKPSGSGGGMKIRVRNMFRLWREMGNRAEFHSPGLIFAHTHTHTHIYIYIYIYILASSHNALSARGGAVFLLQNDPVSFGRQGRFGVFFACRPRRRKRFNYRV